jgi:hypothetical protein
VQNPANIYQTNSATSPGIPCALQACLAHNPRAVHNEAFKPSITCKVGCSRQGTTKEISASHRHMPWWVCALLHPPTITIKRWHTVRKASNDVADPLPVVQRTDEISEVGSDIRNVLFQVGHVLVSLRKTQG